MKNETQRQSSKIFVLVSSEEMVPSKHFIRIKKHFREKLW